MKLDYFNGNEVIDWMRLENLIDNVKTGIKVYQGIPAESNKQTKEISAKFTLDMLGEIGHEDPKAYKILFIIYGNIFKEMFKLFGEES